MMEHLCGFFWQPSTLQIGREQMIRHQCFAMPPISSGSLSISFCYIQTWKSLAFLFL